MSPITTHILDLAKGRPAAGVSVALEQEQSQEQSQAGTWRALGSGSTDDDGRLKTLLPAGTRLEPGTYRLTFATGDYFSRQALDCFYPSVSVTFTVAAGTEHYHVPLLLSPFGYSTYRGS